jgi:hypothetical protein
MSLDPLTAGLDFGKAVVGVIDQFVDDGDLAAKLTNEIMKEQISFSTALVKTKTTPRTDAVVKLLFALRDVAIPLFRPLGTAALTGFGVYLASTGAPTPEWLDAAMVAMFPAWGVSRHAHKSAEIQAETEQHRLEQITQAVSKPNPFLDVED